ncbi:unnamed protein product [Phaeothamnion confervicola]
MSEDDSRRGGDASLVSSVGSAAKLVHGAGIIGRCSFAKTAPSGLVSWNPVTTTGAPNGTGVTGSAKTAAGNGRPRFATGRTLEVRVGKAAPGVRAAAAARAAAPAAGAAAARTAARTVAGRAAAAAPSAAVAKGAARHASTDAAAATAAAVTQQTPASSGGLIPGTFESPPAPATSGCA